MPKGYFVCHSCGKRLEYSPDERPCEVLTGWLLVSQWKGIEQVQHYYFCSPTCLKRWVNTQSPQIPEAFLKAFDEGKDK